MAGNAAGDRRLIPDIQDVEVKTLRRKQGWFLQNQVRPGLESGPRDRRIQVEEKLARHAIDRRRLTKREPQSHRSVERYAVSRLVDDIDVLYRSLLAGEGEPPPASALQH